MGIGSPSDVLLELALHITQVRRATSQHRTRLAPCACFSPALRPAASPQTDGFRRGSRLFFGQSEFFNMRKRLRINRGSVNERRQTDIYDELNYQKTDD